ncbi:penicillin-binding transpeptidase domain-containing protein, partial [Candidatus Zixiibacteriota bacterium]
MNRSTNRKNRPNKPESPSRFSGGRMGLLTALGFVWCLLYLSGMNRTLYLASEVESLQQDFEAVQRIVDRLELEVLEERRGERVVELARQRLGMDFPLAQTEVLAVLPAAIRKGRSLRTYLQNAFAMTVEGVQRQLYPSARAGEPAKADSSGGETGPMIGAPLHSGRLRLLALLFVAGWAICVYRLTDIQLLRSASYHDKARRQHLQEQVIQSRRGEILDREGRLLAVDRLLHTVSVHPKYVTDAPAVARGLTTLLGRTDDEWLAEIANHSGFFYAARQAYLLEEPPPSYELPGGLEITEAYRRTYPQRSTASSVLGYTGIDGSGLEGLELDYDSVLSGRAGRIVQQVDALGVSIPGRDAAREEPVSGMDLRLTLDAVIQGVLEEELARGVETSEAAAGIAVALDPETGAILAMAGWPTFDPNAPDDVDPSQRRNRAITDPFEPGSVLKLVTFTAALDAGRYTPADTIDGGNGVIQVVGSEIRDVHAHGKMSLGEVLQFSSNVGTVKIARHVGENRLYRYARDFGFGQVTGLGLPGEASGVLRKLPEWYGPALESLSIGYGISVTALQIAVA